MQSYEIAVSRAYYTMFYCASALLYLTAEDAQMTIERAREFVELTERLLAS
jgi:uncharacterized protein (UPF0332 family)